MNSVNTIKNYISYLEISYLVQTVPFFDYSLKKQISKPFKVYSLDIGLRNAIGFRFSQDFGKTYESIVAIELIRRKKEIYCWKDSKENEIDFVIKKNLKVKQLIQVCYNINSETKKREIKSLLKARKELKCKDLLIITKEKDGEEIINKVKIKYIPLWKWLLK